VPAARHLVAIQVNQETGKVTLAGLFFCPWMALRAPLLRFRPWQAPWPLPRRQVPLFCGAR
jgi:hypothetical protein